MTPYVAPGQAHYEADLRLRPNYQDGAPRPGWHKLSPLAQCSWIAPRCAPDRGEIMRTALGRRKAQGGAQ